MFGSLLESYVKPLQTHILLIVILFAVFGLYSLQFHAFAADEYTYMNNARAFATGNLENASDLGRFPAFPYALGLAYRVLGDSEATGRVLNVLFALAASLAVLFIVFWSEKNADLAGAAALVTASSPILLFLASRTFSEPLFIFLLLLSTWALLLTAKNEKWWIALGVLFPVLVLTRFFGLYFVPIAALYLLLKNRFKKTFSSKWFYAGILAGAITFLPWILFNLNTTGQASGNVLSFIQGQIQGNLGIVSGQTTGLGLPDRIPSYLLLLPFIIGAPLLLIPLLLFKKTNVLEKIKAQKNEVAVLCVLSTALIVVAMELYGLIHPRLLRYEAVVIPFLAILLALTIVKVAIQAKESELWKKILLGTVILNLIAGFALVGYFGTYEKHVAFREAALYTDKNCESYKSNLEHVLLYYTGKRSSENPECFVLNNYDGLTDKPPAGYSPIYTYGKVAVYRK